MSSITEAQSKLLTSIFNVGPLEAAHLKLLLDQIEADTAETVTYLLENLRHQVAANGLLGKTEIDAICDAIDIRAVTHNASIGTDDVKEATRKAIRRLKQVWPHDVVEGLVALLVD